MARKSADRTDNEQLGVVSPCLHRGAVIDMARRGCLRYEARRRARSDTESICARAGGAGRAVGAASDYDSPVRQ